MRTIQAEVINDKEPAGSQKKPVTNEDENWSFFTHFSGLAPYIGLIGVNLLVPIVIYFLKRKKSVFIAEHVKEAINFNLTYTVAVVVIFALKDIFFVGWCLKYLLFPLAIAAHAIFSVIAMFRAKQGRYYRYPLCIHFLK